MACNPIVVVVVDVAVIVVGSVKSASFRESSNKAQRRTD